MRSEIYNSKSGVTGLIRPSGATRTIIPAWRKGDRVLHRPTGKYGRLVERQTAGGELWKMEADCPCGGGPQAMALGLCKPQPQMQVHACDLELRT